MSLASIFEFFKSLAQGKTYGKSQSNGVARDDLNKSAQSFQPQLLQNMTEDIINGLSDDELVHAIIRNLIENFRATYQKSMKQF